MRLSLAFATRGALLAGLFGCRVPAKPPEGFVAQAPTVSSEAAPPGEPAVDPFAAADAKALADLEDKLQDVLAAVASAVADWSDLRKRAAAAIESLAHNPPQSVDPAAVQEAADRQSVRRIQT